MLARHNIVLLVWGLFDDCCCSARPVTLPSHSNSYVAILDGWNTPGSLLPVRPTSPVQQISLGWTHALLLTEQGEAYVGLTSQVLQQARALAGSSALQLPPVTSASPDNRSSCIWQPVQLLSTMCHVLPASVPVKQVSAGDRHCLLLDHSGCVWAMGSNQHGQLGIPPKQAAAAAVTAAAMTAASGGGGTAAECQQGQQISCFVAVLGLTSGSDVQEPVQQVAAGACHSIAVTASLGRLYAWGWNAHGQCGTGSTADMQQPTLCTALDGVPLACAAAGMAHTVAASRDGAVYAWGWGSDGQLGLSEAAAVEGDEGACCSIAAQSVGGLPAAGGEAAKQQQRSSLLPVLVEDAGMDQEDVVQVACGSRHTVVLTASGRVFAWGLNKHGQCCTAAATGAASGTAAAAAAAQTTTSSLGPNTSFEVQTITTPRAAVLPGTLVLPCSVQKESVAMMEREDVATEATQAGPDGARKLVECEKAVAVRAGRWHTIIEFVSNTE